MTFKVKDLEAAERFVEKTGIRVADRGGETILLDPDDMTGALVAFTSRTLPNDRRA
jgi:hypothetical protein